MSWSFISFFGDSAVVLPTMLATLIILFLIKPFRTLALQWGALFAATGLVVTLSKLAFMGWGIGIAALNFTGFSGHAALSMAFWPVFLWVIACAVSSQIRKVAAVAGVLLALLIGYSRLEVHAHSLSEVLAGLALGAVAGGCLLILKAGKRQPLQINHLFLLILLIPCAMFVRGEKAPTQSLLGQIATIVGGREKVYTREEMLRTLPDSSCTDVRCEW